MPLQEKLRAQKDEWHEINAGKAMRILGTDINGLSINEAKKRLEEYGPNELRKEKRHSPILIFFGQFKEFLIILLIVASIISALVGEILDATVIIAIVFASAILGFFQEFKAEKSLEALKGMASPKANVIRDGEEIELFAKEIVPGDLVTLRAGDKVPTDGRLIESMNLQIDEASLTGESVPVGKESTIVLDRSVPVSDRQNMVFTATTVTSGRGKAVVTTTGMNTEFGKIASMMQAAEEPPTPLELRLRHVGKWLGAISLIVVSIVTAMGIMRGNPLLEMFLWGVALAVAAVPEALPAVVTGSLAIGVQRMVRKNAIIRKLPAVETLGSTTVICTDKTGTLTKNEMTVRNIYVNDKEIKVTGVGFDPEGKFLKDKELSDPEKFEELNLLLKIGALCNDASFKFGVRSYSIGDPTEIALLVAAAKAKIYKAKFEKEHPRINEISFSSERKRMTTVHKFEKNNILYMKGAPEVVLSLCDKIFKDGKQVKLSTKDRDKIIGINERMASEGLRVLGMAFREIGKSTNTNDLEKLEKDLVFVGLQGMIDAPRKEAASAIKVCHEAGIKVIMITGDHKLTAEAVAKELGLTSSESSLTGPDLEKMDDEELERIVEEVVVYARTSPEHKTRIVKALKKKGHVVAVTGDGVNDAPALKNSDIGVAMGITGTEVTKEASDMVLADDNFASIVAAVEEGRGIYNNIKKYLSFLLSCNIGEIIVMFIAGIMGLPLPLITIHLLWVNLVTDGLPAIALGVDPSEPELMKRPPVDPKESVFTKRVKTFIMGIAIIIGVIILPIFIWGLNRADLVYAQTMALTTLVMIEMFNAFNFRSLRQSIFKIGPFTNKWLVIAVASSILLQLAILYIPGATRVFSTHALTMIDWAIIVIISAMPLIIVEIAKNLDLKKSNDTLLR